MNLSFLTQAELRRTKESLPERPRTKAQRKRKQVITELNRRFAPSAEV